MDTDNLCVFVDDMLVAFQLFQRTADMRYVIATFVRSNPDIPGVMEYLWHRFAGQLSQEGIEYINAEQDLGVQTLRMHKLGIGPTNYFRKYTVEPV